jgi:trk system potassium uptake protein
VVGGLVFVIGIHKPLVDAIFEAASGLTTTGITVFEVLDVMPKGILFWRALIQWIGGLGILTFFLAVSFRGGDTSATLFGSEGHKIASPRPVPGIFRTIQILWSIYIFFTIISVVLLWLEGMSFFDALTHSLTAISTGGFSTHDASIGFFSHFAHGQLIEYTVIFFMLMGGINFLIHFQVLTGDWSAPFRNFEMQWFWGIIGGATLIILVDHLARFSHQMSTFSQWHAVFRTCLFQVSSLLTSTGFATKDINAPFFPALSKQIVMFLMLVGGCVGSTAGGIKLARLAILARTLKTELMRITLPVRTVLPVTLQGKIIEEDQIRLVCSLLCAWLVVVFAGAAITAFFSNLNAWQSLSGMLSAVGNMGPFYFSVHTMAGLSPIIKWTYIVGMIAGRLEILPLIVLIFPLSCK